MSDFFFGQPAVWFIVPALIGSGVFLIRSVLMLMGGDDGFGPDLDLDADIDVDVDFDGDAGDAGDSEQVFQVVSIQSLFAFLMGFGWGGFGAIRGAGWGMGSAIATGIFFGAGCVWLLARLFTFIYRLQSRGNINIGQALQIEGTVYITIPAAGTGAGKVRVIIDDHERFLRAISDSASIDPRTPVRVIDLDGDNTVVVTPLDQVGDGHTSG